MITLGVAALSALGTGLLYSALALDHRGWGIGVRVSGSTRSRRVDVDAWLHQAGLDEVDRRAFLGVVAALGVLCALVGYVAFGGVAPALSIGIFGGSFPVASYRNRRLAGRRRAQEAWPRMIEEVRVQTASLGRSIPQALFEVGARGPAELRPVFAAAQREWLLTTDLSATFTVLKDRLADPTADMTCETLLLAHELGGTDLDRRLEALAEDRRADVQGRKDAQSRQAGARFARVFVLLVPAGMAAAGASIGNGREAYRSATGQAIVMFAIALVMLCWFWAGRVMRLPEPQRVFRS
ncbi:MAG: hypothetical protein RIB98_06295 [Acidimicrobiales bacterium]